MAKKEKCILCDEEIQTELLEKPLGTIIKIKKEAPKGVSSDEQNKNELYHVCQACQKKHKNNTKKEVEKLFK